MSIRIKICGLRTPDDARAAAVNGATDIGLVFFPKSPRHLSFAAAAAVAAAAPPGIRRVALTVDPTDDDLTALLQAVPVDLLQLHGHESTARVAAIRAAHGVPVMKAVGIASVADLDALSAYMAVSDAVLVDAKPPADGDLPGGNGLSFDWRLLVGRTWPVPWMLAGGLRPDNVAEAIRLTGAPGVDVSSGVESAQGVKDATLIADFCAAVRSA
ncbi:phosphoribosylanthranilate isomerase [Loktanella fryxellensis]|uniref:N-(5'-phosphoribosyl)anthranilate isomerase n=1 Tax=Loktanella fryxellensis TaxID=245187 RepID=A0A1H8A9H8_9RHOB|nr:phosphoribosylanthranilate isomerase [Loktanella fryxellensis]SEM67542.1 phosphoribosylanthranilate isomerase [Loktanella fryxellensis]